jgi:hypothetical protein
MPSPPGAPHKGADREIGAAPLARAVFPFSGELLSV